MLESGQLPRYYGILVREVKETYGSMDLCDMTKTQQLVKDDVKLQLITKIVYCILLMKA